MNEERRLTEWLAEYRDSLDGVSTPLRVEARLRAEVRDRRRIPVAPWLLAAGAAAMLALGIWIGRPGHPVKMPPAPVAAASPLVEEVPAALEPTPQFATPARPRRTPAPVTQPQPAAYFVMLPGSELMPPAEDLQVLRVRIPRTRIQALGWPVNVDRLDERVLADVIVGNDGLPRAVRLVPANQ